MADVRVHAERENGLAPCEVLTEKGARALSKASESGRTFQVGDKFNVTAVGLYQMTRAPQCKRVVFDFAS